MIRNVVFLLLSLVVSVKANCAGFTCGHNASCTDCSGPEFVGDVEVCRGGKRCACPAGYSGLRCEQEFESCYGGNHKCFNGGKCIQGIEDLYQNEQYVCDCNNAKDKNGTRYVGKYCEMKAIDVCDKNADMFCVNGQSCRLSKDPLDFCRCMGEYTGPHCEFKTGEVPKCDLACENGGKCELGIKNYPLAVLGTNDYWQNHEEGMHCRCKEGFFGLKCEVKSEKCGDHTCYHGSKCVTSKDGSKNCDCNPATTNTTSYAGNECQYAATSFCEKSGEIEGQRFCTNGGTCQKDAADCKCPSGYSGPLCEYNTTLVATPTCSLSCANGGKCKKGVKDSSVLDAIGDQPKVTEDFEHCVCKDGFFGIKCEKQVETCTDGSTVCLHGSKCITLNGKDYSCDCLPASTSTARFAGPNCQHEATSYCTADNKPGSGADDQAFCANGGKCKGVAKGKGHPGCTCLSGFKGDNCGEVVVSASSSSASTTSAGLVVSLTTILIVLAILSCAIYIRVSRRRKAAFDTDMALRDLAMEKPAPTHSTVHSQEDGVVLDMGPEKDMEGNELSNVEII